MSITVKVINGKAPSGGVGGVSDADLSSAIIDFITPGAKGATDFQVTPPGASSRTVVIKAGRYYAPNATGTMVYVVDLDADYTLSPTLPANGSGNPRIDAIVLKIDLGTTPNNFANNVASIVSVQGTTNVTPVAPTQPTIQTAFGAGNVGVRLGDVTAAAGFTTITSGNISDKRTFAGLGTTGLLNGAVTQAKAPFAVSGYINNMKMQALTMVPSWNGLAAGAYAYDDVTFNGLTDVYFAWGIATNGGGGQTAGRLNLYSGGSGSQMGPGFGNVVRFTVFNGNTVPAFASGMNYMAIGV